MNDSIYIDNHAWNEVKLDSLWYIYDMTWAAGKMDYRYTRFSRFILQLLDAFPEKYKRKKARRKEAIFAYDCGSDDAPVYYYVQKKFNRLAQNFLRRIPIRVKPHFVQSINTNFYLPSPVVFGITHFPDKPIWSMVSGITFRDFETDSLFYHLDGNLYRQQKRYGSLCKTCDDELGFTGMEEQKYLREQSAGFNRRNRFILSLCECNIAQIYFNQGLAAPDSLSKMQQLDSSGFYFGLSKASLKSCFRNMNIDFRLQKNKNLFKQTVLLKDNRRHIDFIKNKIEITLARNRLMIELGNKSGVAFRHYGKRKQVIQRRKTAMVVSKQNKISSKKIVRLNEQLKTLETEIDSIKRMIASQKLKSDSLCVMLSGNIWQKVLNHKTLIQPIIQCISLRKNLMDNFKKAVVETRKQIPAHESAYANDINDNLYKPAHELAETGNTLFRPIERRFALDRNHYRAKVLLMKFNQASQAELASHRDSVQRENGALYCWLKSKLPVYYSISMGFTLLREESRTRR